MPTEDLIDVINRYNSKRKSYRIHRKLRKVGLNKYIKKYIFQKMIYVKPQSYKMCH